MSRPTHTDAGLKIEAYRCTWDGGGESAGWVQYNDAEGGDDPMPDAWDDEPDEVVALVLAADAGEKIKALAKIGAENFAAAVEARDAADALTQRVAELRAECERLRADAERYRWLRSRVPGSAYRIMGVIYSEGGSGVDAAIDEARKGQA